MPQLQRTLTYEPYAGARETVGQLTLEGDERVLRARLFDQATGIVLTQVIQSLLLAGLIMWLFNRTVTLHVRKVAWHLAQLTPANLGRRLRLDRRTARRDELSQLEAGVNALQEKLSSYLERSIRPSWTWQRTATGSPSWWRRAPPSCVRRTSGSRT